MNAVAVAPRRVALLATVAEASLPATLPARVVRRYAPQFGLATSPVPLDPQHITVRTAWHARSDRDPDTRWLVDLVREWAVGS